MSNNRIILALLFCIVFVSFFFSTAFCIQSWPQLYFNSIIAELSFTAIVVIATFAGAAAVCATGFFLAPRLTEYPVRSRVAAALFLVIAVGSWFLLPRPHNEEYKSFYTATCSGTDIEGDPMLFTPIPPDKSGAYTLHPETKGSASRYWQIHLSDTTAVKPRWTIAVKSAGAPENRKKSDGVRYEFYFSGNGLPAKKLVVDRKGTDPEYVVNEADGYSQVDVHVLSGPPGSTFYFDTVSVRPESTAQLSGLPLVMKQIGRSVFLGLLPLLPFMLFLSYKTAAERHDTLVHWGTVLVSPFYANGKATYLLFFSPILLLAAFTTYMLLLGVDGNHRICDTLDCNLSYAKCYADQCSSILDVFRDGQVDAIMCGSTGISNTSTRALVLQCYLFGWIDALAVNYFFVHLVAYLGMYLLLSRHVIPGECKRLIAILVATLYMLIPLFEIHCLTQAGVPLLLYVFLDIYKGRQRYWHWVVLILMPLAMSGSLSILFLVSVLLSCWFVAVVWNRKPRFIVLGAIVLFSAAWLVNERSLVVNTLSKDYVSHRTERIDYTTPLPEKLDVSAECKVLTKRIRYFFRPFEIGQFHTSAFSPIILWNALVIVGVITLKTKRLNPAILLTLCIILMICFMQCFPWRPWIYVTTGCRIPPVQMRFFWILPPFWFLLFALCLDEFRRFFDWGISLALILVFGMACVTHDIAKSAEKPQFSLGYSKVFYKAFLDRDRVPYRSITGIRKFVRPELYEEIKNHIAEPQDTYRVVTIHQAVECEFAGAALNGFHTIDGYCGEYPLSHKKAFRKIMARELDKIKAAPKYSRAFSFDTWGNRCRPYLHNNPVQGRYVGLELDTDAMLELNCRYIISPHPIINSPAMNIEFEKKFTEPTPYQSFYLYRVLPKKNDSPAESAN